MTVYYVSKAGNDSNSGLDLHVTKLTIANAVAAAYGAGTGNIVEIVDSGQYNEGDIEIYTRPITVRATGSNKPIMDGSANNNDYAFLPFISGNVFHGLNMRNYDDGLINTGWNSNAKSFILSGCVGHFIGGPQHIGNGMNPAQSAVVNECKIVSDGNSVFSCGNAKVWFNNSVLASNSIGAVITSAQSYTDITASFCTIIGSGYENNSGRNYHLVNQVYKVINCVVSGSGDGINAYDSTYNLVDVTGDPFITWSSDSWDGTARSANTGELTGDPLFISGSNSANADPARAGDVDFGTNNLQNYDIGSGSPANDKGIAYNGILYDLSLTLRTAPPDIGAYEGISKIWTEYGTEEKSQFDDDFVINNYKNLSSNWRYRKLANPAQPPFSFGIRGPARLRGRSTVYNVTGTIPQRVGGDSSSDLASSPENDDGGASDDA